MSLQLYPVLELLIGMHWQIIGNIKVRLTAGIALTLQATVCFIFFKSQSLKYNNTINDIMYTWMECLY